MFKMLLQIFCYSKGLFGNIKLTYERLFKGMNFKKRGELVVRIIGHSPRLFCGFLSALRVWPVRWWLTTGRAGRQIKYLIPFIRQDINRSTVFLHAVFNPPFPWSAASQCPQYPISPLDAIDHRVMIRIDQDDHG